MLGGDYLGVNYPGVFILGGNVLGAGNCLATIADKIYETVSRNQSRNQAKVDRTRKLWNMFLCNFCPLVPNFYLRKGDWVLGSVSCHFCDFPNISNILKTLSLSRSATYQTALNNVSCTTYQVSIYLWRMELILKPSSAS